MNSTVVQTDSLFIGEGRNSEANNYPFLGVDCQVVHNDLGYIAVAKVHGRHLRASSLSMLSKRVSARMSAAANGLIGSPAELAYKAFNQAVNLCSFANDALCMSEADDCDAVQLLSEGDIGYWEAMLDACRERLMRNVAGSMGEPLTPALRLQMLGDQDALHGQALQ